MYKNKVSVKSPITFLVKPQNQYLSKLHTRAELSLRAVILNTENAEIENQVSAILQVDIFFYGAQPCLLRSFVKNYTI